MFFMQTFVFIKNNSLSLQQINYRFMDTINATVFQIEGNTSRPTVLFNASTGQFRMTGRSILENSIRFYEPLIKWIDDYIKNPAEKTEFHMELEYFNTSTSKYLLQILQQFEFMFERGNDVTVVWYYTDEDMQELGNDYQQIVHIPFEFKELHR